MDGKGMVVDYLHLFISMTLLFDGPHCYIVSANSKIYGPVVYDGQNVVVRSLHKAWQFINSVYISSNKKE